MSKSILVSLQLKGVEVRAVDQDIRIGPEEAVTLEILEIARRNKEQIIAELQEQEHMPKPYINKCGDLVIPSSCPVKYRWWAGGQSRKQTEADIESGVL